MSGIMSASDLACYIINVYKKRKKRKIPEGMLQSCLFLCFAFWGAKVEKSFQEGNRIPLSENLFDDEISANFYGIIIKKVYADYKNNKLSPSYPSEEKLFWDNEMLKNAIDSLLEQLIDISEESLEKLIKGTECWKNHYNNPKVSPTIPKEEIRMEFLKRL